MSTVTVNLHAVIMGMLDAQEAAERVNGLALDPDTKGGSRRPEVAEATRSLLALADRLDLLAAHVRQEYWALKGQKRLDNGFDSLNPALKHSL